MYMATVVIPVSNRESELRRSIESVLSQTHQDLEVIVVENNSLVPQVIKSTVESFGDKRLKYYDLPKGVNANHARNLGMTMSVGDYIFFLDSDDEYEPGHIETSIRFLADHDYDFCVGAIKIFDGKSYRVANARPIHPGLSGVEYLFGQMPGVAPTPTIAIKAELREAVRWDECLHRHQDFDFFCQLMSAGTGGALLSPSVIVHWETGRKKKLPTKSVMRFYEKWQADMSREIKFRFLYTKVKEAVKYHNISLFLYSLGRLVKVQFQRAE